MTGSRERVGKAGVGDGRRIVGRLMMPLLVLLSFCLYNGGAEASDCRSPEAVSQALLTCISTRSEAPDLQSMSSLPPELGVSTRLSNGVHLRRISSNASLGVVDGNARHNYSRRQPWNADETLVDIGDKLIDAATLEIIVESLPLSTERLWSNLDPGVMFGMRFHEDRLIDLSRFEVATGRTLSVRRMDGFDRCTIGDGEGAQTNDDRLVLLICRREGQESSGTLVAIDLESGDSLATLHVEEEINWAGFSQSGRHVLVESRPFGTSVRKHLVRMTARLEDWTVLTDDRHHGDFGLDDEGEDVFVMIGARHVEYIRLRDGDRVKLGVSNWRHPMQYGHVSCRNVRRPGWCYFSAGVDMVGAFRVGLRKSNIFFEMLRLAPGLTAMEFWGRHNSSAAVYESQPKAVPSPSGRQVMFTSDWAGRGEINDYVLSVD